MIIVTCANCGKRFKGEPSSQKYKCTFCENLLTFPENPILPVNGQRLCSYCWHAMPSSTELTGCSVCSQKMNNLHVAKAVLHKPSERPKYLQQDEGESQILASQAMTVASSSSAGESNLVAGSVESRSSSDPAESTTFDLGVPPEDEERSENESDEEDRTQEELLQDHSDLVKQLRSMQQERDTLFEEREKIARERDRLNEVTVNLRSRFAELLERTAQESIQLKLNKKHQEKMADRIAAIELEKSHLAQTLQTDREKLALLEQELAALQSGKSDLCAEQARLDARYQREKRSREEIEQRLQNQSSSIREYEVRIAELETHNAAEVREREEVQRQLQKLRDEFIELEAQLSEKQARHAAERAARDQALSEKKAAEERIAQLQQEQIRIQAGYARFREISNEAMEAMAQELQLALRDLGHDISAVQENADRLRSLWKEAEERTQTLEKVTQQLGNCLEAASQRIADRVAQTIARGANGVPETHQEDVGQDRSPAPKVEAEEMIKVE